MLHTSNDRLRDLIHQLTGELAASADLEATARPLRQTLALLHAAAETLEELEKSRVRASRMADAPAKPIRQ